MEDRVMGDSALQDSPVNQPFGAQINNTNTLSTPVMLMVLLIVAVFGLALGYAVNLAGTANEKAVIAEREARLAQNRYDNLIVEIKVIRGILEQNGINLPPETQR